MINLPVSSLSVSTTTSTTDVGSFGQEGEISFSEAQRQVQWAGMELEVVVVACVSCELTLDVERERGVSNCIN